MKKTYRAANPITGVILETGDFRTLYYAVKGELRSNSLKEGLWELSCNGVHIYRAMRTPKLRANKAVWRKITV